MCDCLAFLQRSDGNLDYDMLVFYNANCTHRRTHGSTHRHMERSKNKTVQMTCTTMANCPSVSLSVRIVYPFVYRLYFCFFTPMVCFCLNIM